MKRREALMALSGMALFPALPKRSFVLKENFVFHFLDKYGWAKQFDFKTEAFSDSRSEGLEALYVNMVRTAEWFRYNFVLLPREIAEYVEGRPYPFVEAGTTPKKGCIRRLGSSLCLKEVWAAETLNNTVIMGRGKKSFPSDYLQTHKILDYLDCPCHHTVYLKNSPFV